MPSRRCAGEGFLHRSVDGLGGVVEKKVMQNCRKGLRTVAGSSPGTCPGPSLGCESSEEIHNLAQSLSLVGEKRMFRRVAGALPNS